MSKQVVNVGASSNDGTGDTLRVSQQKANANFTELYDKGLQQVTDVGNETTNAIYSSQEIASYNHTTNKGAGLSENGVIIAKDAATAATVNADLLSESRIQQVSDKNGVQCVVDPADNFTNDTTASAGGIVIGQYYHTAGVVKIRLT
jgi:hypothetical protein